MKIIKLNNKLNYKFLELFCIIKKVLDINYKLNLLLKIKIYLVFYIILFKLALLSIKLKTNIKCINELLEYKIEVILDL